VDFPQRKGGPQTRRFFEVLNTPIAVFAALFVVVAVCGFLYFGYYSPRTAHTGTPRTISEKTRGGTQTLKSASPTTPESTEKERSTGVTTATSTATASSSP
jgi:hypothetical protein